MRINAWTLSLMMSLAVVATVEAQGGGGRRGGGFGGGGMFGGGGGILSIADNETVQKEISLGTDEAAKVKTLVEEMRGEMRQAMESSGGGGNFQDMSREEREKMREKMTETNKTLTDKYLPKVKEILTADQFTRVQQIHWQAMGTAAFSEAEIIKALPIAKDQQDKIKALTAEYDAKQRELFGGGRGGAGGGDREAMREKMQEIGKERETKINEVLTKDQLDKFAMLKGKAFDVEQLRQGRGGRGGGGGAGGGGKGKRPQPKAE